MNNKGYYLSEAIEVIQEVLDGGGEFRLYPKGISMLPLIKQEQDSVVLRKRVNDVPLKKHEIAFYRRSNGQFVLHRVMKIAKDGTYVMCGDNQLVLEKGIHDEQILGYVAQIYKKNQPLELTSLRYRLYVGLWTWMPLRHCVKFPRRLFGWLKRKLKNDRKEN